MSTTEATTERPFSRIKVRITGLVFCGDDVALLRPDRTDSTHYTTIGGNIAAGEDFRDAALRELQEELGLAPDQVGNLELVAMADARVARPGAPAACLPGGVVLLLRRGACRSWTPGGSPTVSRCLR
ncbi:NUDIX hydrolase [Kitasatospora sp. NPDC101155]|uniref:NUDIX hydrolase n=1 Tax=Kitasatospora sp. NPDC101155 TaxID=3364097 RepID=UPI00380C25DF